MATHRTGRKGAFLTGIHSGIRGKRKESIYIQIGAKNFMTSTPSRILDNSKNFKLVTPQTHQWVSVGLFVIQTLHWPMIILNQLIKSRIMLFNNS